MIKGKEGENCSDVCKKYDNEYICDVYNQISINTIENAQKYLGCSCFIYDVYLLFYYQPAYVTPGLNTNSLKTIKGGCCIIGNDPNFSCDFKEKNTIRLCACLPNKNM